MSRYRQSRPKVVVVQEFLPAYRLKFFELVREELSSRSIDFTVISSKTRSTKSRRLRHGSLWWVDEVRLSTVTLPAVGEVTYQWALRRIGRDDFVVVEQANRHILTWILLARQFITRGPSVAFWGHGQNFQGSPTAIGSLLARVKRRAITWPRWWFAYTDSVSEYLQSNGVDSKIVTSVRNSTDTAHLRGPGSSAAVSRASDDLVFAYIGGLYANKRLDFLVSACELLAGELEGFKLVIAGTGELEAWVCAQAATRPWLQYVGPIDGASKADLLHRSSLILCPGLVGLLAVDSLAAGVPLVTIQAETHSPEISYLNEKNAVILPKPCTPSDYASAVQSLVGDRVRLEGYRQQAYVDGGSFGLEQMTARFADGVSRWIYTSLERGSRESA